MKEELLNQRQYLLRQLCENLNWSYEKRESKVEEINAQIRRIDELLISLSPKGKERKGKNEI